MAARAHPSLVAVPLIGVALLAGLTADSLPIPMPIRVGGQTLGAPPGATFGEAVTAWGLTAEPGDLVDVKDDVLERGAFPGKVLLNGRTAVPRTVLQPGDVIRVVDGRDRREPLVRERIPVPRAKPGNPQFFLATAPGVQIVTRGEVSGKILEAEFVPEGDAEFPPAVALTFDDGPSPAFTPQILDILERFRVRATFFVIGYLAARHPGLIERELAAGMSVASHSWGHPLSPQFRQLPRGQLRSEIVLGKRVLMTLGAQVKLFRPPQGSYSDRVVRMARTRGLRIVLWNTDPEDWRPGASASAIADAVLSHVQPGSIVLLHDGGGNRRATVEALPTIIRGIRDMGLRLVSIEGVAP
jgi:peptidoglycan/xylan/chitin deacetylase (PgdA/CDA1 family)